MTRHGVERILFVIFLGFCSFSAFAEPRKSPMRFIWLMQGKEEMDLSFLRSEHSDAIQVVWGKDVSSSSQDAFYLPNSTCTEGRNFLLQMAVVKEHKGGVKYDYFIYTEDDAELEEVLDFGAPHKQTAATFAAVAVLRFGATVAIPTHVKAVTILGRGSAGMNVGDPYRTFEKYLEVYEPAVGFPFNGYGLPDPPEEMKLACWWDHLMVAFHRDTLSSLLPYWTGMDSESWWFPQRIVTVLASALFHSHRIQFNAVAAMNTEHRWNPDMGDVDWDSVNAWILPAISDRSALLSSLCAFSNDQLVDPGAPSPRRGAQYEGAGRARAMDACHPYVIARDAFWQGQPSEDRAWSQTHKLNLQPPNGCDKWSLVKAAHKMTIELLPSLRRDKLSVLAPVLSDGHVTLGSASDLYYRLRISERSRPKARYQIKVYHEAAPHVRGAMFLGEGWAECEGDDVACVFEDSVPVTAAHGRSGWLMFELWREDGSKADVFRAPITIPPKSEL